MNFREGMRRVGTVAGVAGAIVASIFCYALMGSIRDSRIGAERFNALVRTPTIVKLLHPDSSNSDSSGRHIPSGFVPDSGEFAAPDNRDQIKSVTFAGGEVLSIQLTGGATQYRTTPEAFYNYLLVSRPGNT
jgi:hypothetical protein